MKLVPVRKTGTVRKTYNRNNFIILVQHQQVHSLPSKRTKTYKLQIIHNSSWLLFSNLPT